MVQRQNKYLTLVRVQICRIL